MGELFASRREATSRSGRWTIAALRPPAPDPRVPDRRARRSSGCGWRPGKTVARDGEPPVPHLRRLDAAGELRPGPARRRRGTCRRRRAGGAGPTSRSSLLAHLLGDGSFVRRQPIRYASVDEANLAAVDRGGQRLRHHRCPRRVRRRPLHLAAPAGAVPPDPRHAEPDRGLARRARSVRPPLPREVRARPRCSTCRSDRSGCSSTTSGRPTARSRWTKAARLAGSTTPRPAGAWSTTSPACCCASASSRRIQRARRRGYRDC